MGISHQSSLLLRSQQGSLSSACLLYPNYESAVPCDLIMGVASHYFAVFCRLEESPRSLPTQGRNSLGVTFRVLPPHTLIQLRGSLLALSFLPYFACLCVCVCVHTCTLCVCVCVCVCEREREREGKTERGEREREREGEGISPPMSSLCSSTISPVT